MIGGLPLCRVRDDTQTEGIMKPRWRRKVMRQAAHAYTEGEIAHALRLLPTPTPPPWLRARVMAEVAAVERRRHARRTRWRRCFALAVLVQCAAYAASERMGR